MTGQQKIYAIVPAAGAGVRMGSGVAKQFLLLNGKPVIEWTLDVLCANSKIVGVAVVVPAADRDDVKKLLNRARYEKVIAVIAGGGTRQESVKNGLKSLPDDADYILVHDGVRPLVEQKLIDDVIEKAFEKGAAAAAIPVTDTVKAVKDGVIAGSLLRDEIWRIQTPQCFKAALLREGYMKAKRDGFIASDESSLVELTGHPVYIVEGTHANLKITNYDDILAAEAFFAIKAKSDKN